MNNEYRQAVDIREKGVCVWEDVSLLVSIVQCVKDVYVP